jgi:hypothetical protein
MSDPDETGTIWRRSAPAGGALFGCLLVAYMAFASAAYVNLPPSSEELRYHTVRIDGSRGEFRQVQRRDRPGFIRVHATLLRSPDYPGVEFRLMGAAGQAEIEVPAILDIATARDPQEASSQHRENPNFMFEIEVRGVKRDGTVAVDPGDAHLQMSARRGGWSALGTAFLLIAALPAYSLVRTISRMARR